MLYTKSNPENETGDKRKARQRYPSTITEPGSTSQTRSHGDIKNEWHDRNKVEEIQRYETEGEAKRPMEKLLGKSLQT